MKTPTTYLFGVFIDLDSTLLTSSLDSELSRFLFLPVIICVTLPQAIGFPKRAPILKFVFLLQLIKKKIVKIVKI